jgi:surface antigen
MRANIVSMRVLLPLAALASVVVFGQGNTGYLRKTPAGNFTAEDWTALKAAVQAVLNSPEGSARSWSNPATGSGGEVRSLKSYHDSGGALCKQLQMDSKARGYQGSYKQELCQAGGRWLSTDGGLSFPVE